MDEVTSTETSPSCNEEAPNDETPLWQYVIKVEKPPGSTIKSGGNTHFKCNYCGGVFLGSYSRVKAYLLKIPNKGISACLKVTPSHRLEMQRTHDQIENDKFEREQRSQIPLPSCCEILKYSQVYEPYRSIVGQERGRTHRDLNERRKIN